MGDSRGLGSSAFFSPTGALATSIKGHRIQPEVTKSLPTFYRNLEEALDGKRASDSFYATLPTSPQDANTVDFCSGDVMSMARSVEHRAEFLGELESHPDFALGTTSTRLMGGNYSYIEKAEAEIAAFHRAETGLLMVSGFDANLAIWTTIPKPGDVILYDVSVHASTNDGIRQSMATDRIAFPHSDVDAFRDTLRDILATRPLVRQGKRSVLVAVESIYSMEGDLCPLQELLEAAQDVFQDHEGGIQFVVDEAHSVGFIGPGGRGLVCELELEKEIAVVMHTFSKSIGAAGGIILGNKSIRDTIVNFGRAIMFSTTPTFPFVAAITTGYKVLTRKQKDREHVQDMARLFFDLLTSHPLWSAAQSKGLLRVPLADGWEEREINTHLLAIFPRSKSFWWLYYHLLSAGFRTFPATYPAVPPGEGRLRVIIHAHNTEEQVRGFVNAIFAWVQEMMDIDAGKASEPVTKAAKQVYDWMRQEQEWPENRTNIESFYKPGSGIKNTLYSRGGYFMKGDPAAFDAPFFSITAKEAAAMDPQQRWLLETSYRALENAGIPLEKAAGTNTAVYASSTSEDYIMMIAKDPDHAPQMVSTATSPSIQSNRLSWYFDLRGPSIHVNTACSSSMITMDLACQTLRSGQSSMALVTSANSLLSPEWSLYMSNMNFLSPDSRCYSFDHRANGYARGEGVIVLVLKRLSDAIRDRDTIRAVIRGTGSNQDGHTPALPQPSQSAQETLIRQVYKSASLGFEATRYVEAHGTGTQIGDVTEATALGRVFRGSRSASEPLYLGSIKANIGHLEGGSGLASILKTIQILETGIIPPQASFEKLNPKIKAKFYHLAVPTKCIPWPSQGLRRISIDSFGFGGANSHIIIDDALHTIEALGVAGNHRILNSSDSRLLTNGSNGANGTNGMNGMNGANGVNGTNGVLNGLNGLNGHAEDHATSKPNKATPGYQLLTWSARDEAALKRMLHLYDGYIKAHMREAGGDANFLGDLAYTLAERRTLMTWRSFSVVDGTHKVASETLEISSLKCERAARENGVAFIFTGQGAQYANMGLELLPRYPVFQATLTEAQGIFKELGAEWSLLDELRDPERINKPEFSQPLCTALQVALVELLASFNVFPDVVVGHSSGEIAAAYAAGALSLRSACAVAYHRGRLAERVRVAAASTSQPGAMMSVNLAETEAESYLERHKALSLPGRVSVACINSPTNVTLSGDEATIDQLQAGLEKEGVFARKLKTGVAYHSPAMHQVAGEYLSSLGRRLEPRELQHNGGNPPLMVSTVTGHKVAAINLQDPQYWVDNLESPVRFADALQYVVHTAPKVDGLNKPITNYLEIGPHAALQRPVRDSLTHAGNSTARYGSVLWKQDSPTKTILQLVGRLFTSGHPTVSITAANQQDGPSPSAKPVVDGPEYPFDTTQTYWHEPRTSHDWRRRGGSPRSLLGSRASDWNPLQPRWRKMLTVEEVPWVADHVVVNTVVFPAVGSVIMAMEAVRQTVTAAGNSSGGGGPAIRGYLVKEATFVSPIVVTQGQTTEVMTQLRPLQQTYERSSTRFEVDIFSYGENYWRACNKHIIHVEFEQEPRGEVDGGREFQTLTESMARKHDNAKAKADVTIPSSDFYRWLQENGFQYGPTFSLTDQVRWDGDDTAVAEINVGSPVDSFQEGVVHPGILDSCLQVCPIVPSRGMSKNVPTSVPHKIKDAWIAATGWQNPSTNRVKVLTQAKLKPFAAGLDCEVAVLSEAGRLLCHIKKLEMSPVMARELGAEDNSARTLLHRIDWKPHLSSLRALQHTTDWEKVAAHMKKYVSWIERRLGETSSRDAAAAAPAPADLTTRLQALATRRPSWRLFTEIGQNLAGIIRGEPPQNEELELTSFSSSPLLQDYLDDAVVALCANPDLEAYLELLAHQKPNQKILEVGARRGLLTSYALSVFQGIEARTGGVAFSKYTYSDASTAAVDEARQRVSASKPEYQDRVDFLCLDANKDLTAQGSQPASYDVIFFAAGIITLRGAGAKEIGAVLQNIRRVLVPGGQLVLLDEISSPDRFEIGFGFGVTADWWRGGGQEDDDGRTITGPQQWDAVLKDNGFSGTDLVIRDYQSDEAHLSSLVVSTSEVAAQKPGLPQALAAGNSTRVFIVVLDDDDFQKSLAQSVLQSSSSASSWNSNSSRVLTLSEMAEENKLESGDIVICLADVYRPFLHPMGQTTLNTVRSWVQQSTNLFWVTAYSDERDDKPTNAESSSSAAAAYAGIKDGLLRVLRSEFSLNRIVSLTVGDSRARGDVAACGKYVSTVFESAFGGGLHGGADDEYVVRDDGVLYTGRLVDDVATNKDLSSSIVPEAITEPWLPGPPLTLAIQTRGQLETLQFREDLAYNEELGPTDVEIEARVWGVGFRDVFLALGRLDEDDFGADVAGVVTRVGAEVRSVKPGDRVCMQTTDGMKTYPRAHEWTTAKIADSVSFEDACAVIIPGMTALQGLIEVARLQKGEKVLIHSASGGTGQVALQIAQMVGAEVFATVGYDHKKQLLMDQYGVPADHIFYSRDTSFARGVMRVTDGYGVDVVLNSLAGESLRASWDCIAPYGRMIEIGKADINANASLPMACFAKNCLYAGVDLHHIVKDMKKKDLAHKLLRKTMDLARDGSVRAPRPLHAYPVDKVEDAFRYLASGKNTGRIVISIDPLTIVQKHLIKRRTWTFDGKATYLVAGGLGGIGRSILKWMVARGAKHLLVPSRSGAAASVAASEVVRELSDQGIVVSTPKCDVSSEDSLSQMLQESAATLPPIRGCIVATMVLNDCMFENMTLPQWEQTSRSKVEASWNLHNLLPDLDFLIMLSSVSGVIGNPGQSNYAAGCTFQDALARLRNSQRGQKAVSIDLGVMRSIGVVAETERLQQHFQSSKGFVPIEEAEFLSLLDICCDPSYQPGPDQCQMVMGLETPASLLARSLEPPEFLQRRLFARFSQLPGQAAGINSGSNSDDAARLFRQAESAAERAQVVVEALSKRLARTLSIKLEDVDTHQALHAYGVDSLIAVELRSWLGKEFAADVPVFEIVSGKTIEAVGELVATTSRIEKRA
ncbi:polyketide synthase [Triangularia verruculosa]|uniref:Polyketide synthase n=1 Tax=Triangularia verruculosa TaxID=2587418 RepID=A0AAN7AYH9_9PEZI|nr:polyketide synthase [Triangularia verruculosa]